MKTRRLEQRGRPLRKYAAMASPTSAGNGIWADRPPFPWTVILAGFPIDIFQVERNDFSGPQAQPGEQQ